MEAEWLRVYRFNVHTAAKATKAAHTRVSIVIRLLSAFLLIFIYPFTKVGLDEGCLNFFFGEPRPELGLFLFFTEDQIQGTRGELGFGLLDGVSAKKVEIGKGGGTSGTISS